MKEPSRVEALVTLSTVWLVLPEDFKGKIKNAFLEKAGEGANDYRMFLNVINYVENVAIPRAKEFNEQEEES